MRMQLAARVVATTLTCLAVGAAAPTLAAAATNTNDAGAAKPTFYREVLPILQENCQECHRTAGTSYGGQLAPMGLETYDEARPWAKAIAKQVESREMPPWDASPRHKGVFVNERSLEDDEIATLVRWASNGAPAGNPSDAPPRRVFINHDGWMIGEPSLVVKMPEPYFVKDDVKDLYAAFYVDLTDEMLPKDMWIKAFQCKPGSRIIHHFNAHLAYPDEVGGLPEPPSFPGKDSSRRHAPAPSSAASPPAPTRCRCPRASAFRSRRDRASPSTCTTTRSRARAPASGTSRRSASSSPTRRRRA